MRRRFGECWKAQEHVQTRHDHDDDSNDVGSGSGVSDIKPRIGRDMGARNANGWEGPPSQVIITT